ncbi:MAG: hypothetical protein ACREQH_01255, partial [Candidatus Binatus sp.]
TPQGVAFESPFDGVYPGEDIVAITNTLPAVIGPDPGFGLCAAPPAGAGFTLGTITEFARSSLNTGTPGSPGYNDLLEPFNNSPVTALDDTTMTMPYSANATIGGCDTFLLGPVGAAFDQTGFLFVVNEAAVSAGGPGFVTVYLPGEYGNTYPFAAIGIPGSDTEGIFKDPAYVTVSSALDFFDDVIFVTDVGDNSVKIVAPFTDGCEGPPFFFCQGTLLGTIQGNKTRLKRPEGVALGVDDGALYVVSDAKNSLLMFTDFTESGGNISPTLILSGKSPRMNLPVDVALPEFTPSAIRTGGATN